MNMALALAHVGMWQQGLGLDRCLMALNHKSLIVAPNPNLT
jgi:hypothetical protein